jgi:O-antigen/teichoic acid export membrane protein/D-alanine-D-alanine ligase-like ATP-grasp enzyme
VSDRTEVVAAADEATGSATHVRGSTLLLVGRLLSIGINLASQVLIARQLSKSEFGAFAIAIALAGLGQVVITLGLHRGATSFIARFEEEHAYSRLAGTILLYIGVIVAMGGALVVVVALAQSWLVGSGLLDPAATSLLLILVLLAPIDALDDMLVGLFAVLGSPRSIFMRRYVIGPSIRFAVAAVLVLAEGDARQLAIGYLLGGVFGVVLYGALFVRLLGDRGLLAPLRAQRPEVPVRAVLGFSVPLLSTDAIWLLLNTFPLIVLTAASGLREVAAFQVIKPAASLNLLVSASFAVLYVPIASRLAARGDQAVARELYWRTTIWVAVMTFPVFVGTFALGQGLAGFLFGERYASSGLFLSILSIGYFVHAALGFNAATLVAQGHPRTVLLVNVVTATASVVLSLSLIPLFGAVGAASAATLTLLVQNGLMQVALWRRVGIPLIDREALGVYAIIASAAGVLVAVELIGGFGWWSLALAGAITAIVLYCCRGALRIDTLFPEVHPITIRAIAALGLPARRLAAGLDLLYSTGPVEAWRRIRTGRRWMGLAGLPRREVYRRIWMEAADAIGAEAEPAGFGAIELRAGERRVVVRDHILPIDRLETLELARDKPAVSRILRAHGLPVPDQLAFAFADFEAAAAFLHDRGGPCVVKPADGATGSGVTTQIRDRAGLVRAVIRAGRDANDLIIERQVAGHVYRLLFLDGVLLDAIERLPPRVTGDGRSTVGELIDEENRRRIEAGGTDGLSLLKVDLDCIMTLRSMGIDLRSVPADGATIAVKTATNQNGSADNRSVIDEVAPALAAQARQAAAVVGVRLAGVDIVTPDPTTTLESAGGVIVEVNGDPGVHYHYLIRQPATARRVAIPIARLLLGGSSA